jgi:hypothetical protein
MNLNEIIADILYDHLKGKHKDALSIKLANQIIEASAEYYKDLNEASEFFTCWSHKAHGI